MTPADKLRSGTKTIARGLIGAVSPALLRRLQLARARRIFLHDPARGPRRLLLEPTTGCNHKCVMCWDHSPRLAQPTGARHMPFDRVSSLLREMAEIGAEEVWLAGRGEPLVHPRAPEILQLIGSLGMRSIITTNAGRLTDELADKICDWGLQQLSVSIDSGSPETYQQVHGGPPADRARILAIIRRLAKRADCKPRLLVSMVLSQLNFRELPALVRDAIDAGATGIVVGGMRPVPFDSTDLALSEDDWARVRDDLAQAAELARKAGIDLATDNIRGPGSGEGSGSVNEGSGSANPGSAFVNPSSPPAGKRAAAWPYADMACFIGHLFTVIDVDGVVHGCCTCQNKLGSLEKSSFRDIWWSRQYHLYRRVLREMPSTGLTSPRCECRHGCGHVPENAQLQREFGFRFPAHLPPSESATRIEVAGALCRHLGVVLPAKSRDFAFADLPAPRESDRPAPADRLLDYSTPRLLEEIEAASRLRQVGIMAGIGSMDGVQLFEPQRMVAREEFEEILLRALIASRIDRDKAHALIAQSRTGTGHPAEPLRKPDLEAWLARLAASLPRG
jgi:MoaA/NifB/PqqE/SkfB family radical SAM enzyme